VRRVLWSRPPEHDRHGHIAHGIVHEDGVAPAAWPNSLAMLLSCDLFAEAEQVAFRVGYVGYAAAILVGRGSYAGRAAPISPTTWHLRTRATGATLVEAVRVPASKWEDWTCARFVLRR
jgi:hypothetical protein